MRHFYKKLYFYVNLRQKHTTYITEDFRLQNKQMFISSPILNVGNMIVVSVQAGGEEQFA